MQKATATQETLEPPAPVMMRESRIRLTQYRFKSEP